MTNNINWQALHTQLSGLKKCSAALQGLRALASAQLESSLEENDKASHNGQASNIKGIISEWGVKSDANLLVFVDGEYSAEASSLSDNFTLSFGQKNNDDVTVLEDDKTKRFAHSIKTLMDASECITIKVCAKHPSSNQHLIVFHCVTGAQKCCRLGGQLQLDQGCNLTVDAHLIDASTSPVLITHAIQTEVAQKATLQWSEQQTLKPTTILLSQHQHTIAGTMMYHTMNLGEGRAEAHFQGNLTGEAARCQAFGLLMGQGEADVVQHWHMAHLAPQATSDMHYRALMADRSQGAWLGHAHVSKQGEGADVTQMSRQILLSSQARMHAKPELTILCDAVACRHGATVGQIDEKSLFYLRSRGIDVDQARLILLWSFVQTILTPLCHGKCFPQIKLLLRKQLMTMISTDRNKTLQPCLDFWELDDD